MKEIAVIISDINKVGGAERCIVNMANLFEAYGKYHLNIFSCYSKNSDVGFYELPESATVFHLNNKYPSSKIGHIKGAILSILKIRKIIKIKKIDVLIGLSVVFNIYLPFLKSLCKVVAWEHTNYLVLSRFYNCLRRFSYSHLDAVVVLTQFDYDKFTFIKKNKLFIIPNMPYFTSAEQAALVAPRVIAFGRLSKEKGFDFLIKAAVKMQKHIPDWHLDIYGNGAEYERLQALIQLLGVQDFVSIKGFSNCISEELLGSSIHVLTSRYEGFPLALLEAQTAGVPSVSFNCIAGPSDIITDGQDGFLLPVGDTDGIADKVIMLAKDYELRKRMGNAASKSSLRYSRDNIFLSWHNFFQQLLVN